MDSLEPKKLALLRIWQILQKYTDLNHPLTQDEIVEILDRDYGISIERKAVSRNLSLLKEAGIDIESRRAGNYLETREFEDSELKLLIDGVLQSKHITAHHSKDLIEKLCGLSNKYFRSHVKNVYSVNDWSKTENQALFYNIDVVDEAIEAGKQVQYDYNKYGVDAKLHKSSFQRVSPYQLILHNQRYYLMGYSDFMKTMTFQRMDHISNMQITDKQATPITDISGYENGIDYKRFSSSMPYMFYDEPKVVEFIADGWALDQIIDWFGKDIKIDKTETKNIYKITLKSSPTAMLFWAMQYTNECEVIKPIALRERIKETINKAKEKYDEKPI